MSKATPKFKNDPYVKDYYQVATENQARQTGLSEAGQLPPPDVAQSEDSLQPSEQPHLSVQPQTPITNVPQADEKAD